MTLADRVAAYARAFAKWPDSIPTLTRDRCAFQGTWVIGNNFSNPSKFYGAYPRSYLERVMAFYPDLALRGTEVLHVFSGSVPRSFEYVRCDVRQPAEFACSVYDLPALHATIKADLFRLVLADPPYSDADALRYGTPMIDRRRALAALAVVTAPGGHLVWLDTCWPMHRKAQWVTIGRILVIRSTNHRVRVATFFERTT